LAEKAGPDGAYVSKYLIWVILDIQWIITTHERPPERRRRGLLVPPALMP
jgi:hypothetical protein